MAAGVRTSHLRERARNSKRLCEVEQWGCHHLIMLKDAPLNITLLPQLPVPFNTGGLESIDQEARSLIEQIEPMSQLPGGQRIAPIDRRV